MLKTAVALSAALGIAAVAQAQRARATFAALPCYESEKRGNRHGRQLHSPGLEWSDMQIGSRRDPGVFGLLRHRRIYGDLRIVARQFLPDGLLRMSASLRRPECRG